MSASVGSRSQMTEGGRSDNLNGGGPGTVVSTTSSSSANRVMVEEFFPYGHQDPICLIPGDKKSSLQGQSCILKIFDVDIPNRSFSELVSTTALLSAFFAEIDRNGNQVVELRCNLEEEQPKEEEPCFRFEFEDQIRNIRLMPLPLSTDLQFAGATSLDSKNRCLQVIGFLLVVVAKRSGVSVHSVVLSRGSARDPFRISEFKKVSRGSLEESGNQEAESQISLFLHNTRDALGRSTGRLSSDPILYTGIISQSLSNRSHRLDALACPLICHQCPLFRFSTQKPTRSLKKSLLLSGGGSITKDVSISSRCDGTKQYCTISALFDSELKIIRLPSLQKWGTEALKSEDIITIPLSPLDCTGRPCHVIHLLRDDETSQYVSYLVVCDGKEEEHSSSPQLSPLKYEASPIPIASERRNVPPQRWTANETRNAVIRARRDILASVERAFQENEGEQENVSPTTNHLPYNVLSPHHSNVGDENNDISIFSPDTAILDMSDGWMKPRQSESSLLSPLAGMVYAEQDSESLMLSQDNFEIERSPRQSSNHQQPSSGSPIVNLFSPESRVILVSVPAKGENASCEPVQTEPFPICSNFPKSLDAFSVYEKGDKLILAAVARGSTKATIATFQFKDSSRDNLASGLTSLPVRSVELNIPEASSIHAIDLYVESAGGIRLRATTATYQGIHHEAQDEFGIALRAHKIAFVSLRVPALPPRSMGEPLTNMSPKLVAPNAGDAMITEKLDRIVAALQKLETSVDERLTILEKRESDNAKRLSALERSLRPASTRVEI